jgi:adenine/guanine phosphoribosyltransferase-like PRPP-binding protein
MTTGKDFAKGARARASAWKMSKLPFQYTPEGRAQLAAKRSLLVTPQLQEIQRQYLATPLPIDLSQVTSELVDPASNKPFMPAPDQISRFYTTMDEDVNVVTGRALLADYLPDPAPTLVEQPEVDERQMVRSHASYLTQLFEDADASVQKFRIAMRAVDFDTLVGSGISGALSAHMFARAIGIHFAIVRKGNDGTHSCNRIEGNVGKRWVFVDDLICSGETRTRVRDAMKFFCEKNKWVSVEVGAYLYYGNKFLPKEIDGNV